MDIKGVAKHQQREDGSEAVVLHDKVAQRARLEVWRAGKQRKNFFQRWRTHWRATEAASRRTS